MIVATRGGGEVAFRDVTLGQLIRATNPRIAGVVVTPGRVLGLPAWMAAVDIASGAVSSLNLRVYRGEGVDRQQVVKSWQAQFFTKDMPNDVDEAGWTAVWAQTETSLTNSNNAYWLKLKDRGRVAAIYVLEPTAVEVRWNRDRQRKEFRVTLPDGSKTDWLDRSSVLHFRRRHFPGLLKDPTPIELHREALGTAVAKLAYEASYYEGGIMNSLAVSFPREVKKAEADQWREVFQAEHAGLQNKNQVRVFGGGATVSTVGLSLQDSQYIESVQISLDDVARLTSVTPSLIRGQTRQDKPITPEHELARWLRFGLAPRLKRIEATILADPDFFGPGATAYPWFDTDDFVRGDLKTEAEVEHMQVQDGTLLPDEARARRGQGPLPGGVGQIPQVVPVGGQENPVPTPASAPVVVDGSQD